MQSQNEEKKEQTSFPFAAFPFLLASPPTNETAPTNNIKPNKASKEIKEQHETCNKYINSGLNRNVTIRFLMERLIDLGCTPPNGFINCIDCGTKYASGGFGVVEVQERTLVQKEEKGKDFEVEIKGQDRQESGDSDSLLSSPIFKMTRRKYECNDKVTFDQLPQEIKKQNDNPNNVQLRLLPEIFLCQQHIVTEDHAHQSLVHELIHAIDLCRTKMDPINNCIHMACTEIRAENLSGECNMMREVVNRRMTNFKSHGGACVKRRAVLSVKANPVCKDRAEEYVDVAFDRCYRDTFPFDRHPNLR